MILSAMLTALRTELKDPATLWTEAELTRAVTKAVSDVDRFFPLEAVYEATLGFTVTAEAWTSAAAAGTWVSLAYNPIEYNSESVTELGGEACVRDTDYTIDYSNGKITHISGGKIGNTEACHITYTKSKIALDLAALSIIQIQRVEYPYGNVPQSMASYDFFNEILWLTSVESASQAKLTAGKHVAIRYTTQNTVPGVVVGSFPRHLDEIVVKGAAAYACFIKALQFEHQAVTDYASARSAIALITSGTHHALVTTALGNVTAIHTLVNTALGKIDAIHTLIAAYFVSPGKIDAIHTLVTTALGKVDTYLAGGTESTKAILAQIATDIANLRTGIETAVDAIATYSGAVVTTDIAGATGVWADELKHILNGDTGATPSAELYLELGDDFIDKQNKGSNVGVIYHQYAEAALSMASLWDSKRKDLLTQAQRRIDAAIAYANEAAQRLSNLRSYIEQGAGYASIADGFRGEALARLDQIDRYIAEILRRLDQIDKYLSEASVRLGQIDRYMTEASTRLDQIDRYLSEAFQDSNIATQCTLLAEKFRAEGTDRRFEFWIILTERAQLRGRVVSSVSPRQIRTQV